ncbi:MAG: UDP-N-acetylglucosamine-peptide N-acetylglucosaminyltransferase [Selenomonas sp.]|uniref:O-linked N-acetylglucosamine transferase, SPINDLY family protein n=1 Tax=Selenomonas sp. TaxID=2053611 RepID=UPI0025D7C746|nr:UDP-N-acetylglucosamine-peptide N-acetylglucosaminyltransferase [Selenomonas sp.]MCR5439578.1 UDP-N-acetylglucosamine-peptide N-acetylglucosaminyltransferase [Selenomonas sp.]
MDYIAMDEKLEPVTQLLLARKPQMALERLQFMIHQGIFFPEEMWRVYQRLGDCYFAMLDVEKTREALWECLMHPTGMPLRKQQEIYSNYLFVSHYSSKITDEEMRKKHFLYNQLLQRNVLFTHRKRKHEKLRIGYLAPMHCKNVVSFFSVHLMTMYDRSRFEVYCYSLHEEKDEITTQLKEQVDGWHVFPTEQKKREMAEKIFQDEIDILVDLGVHTSGGRTLQIMGYRPAPVQMAGIGYMSTSGMHAVDYFLTDCYCDPTGKNDGDFTEKLIRLPQSHFCYMPPERILQCKGVYQLHDPIWFGSFNNIAKITEPMLRNWMKILQRVPKAKLLIKNASKNVWNIKALRRKMRRLGFPEERYVLEESSADYLDRYLDVDIILDTYPYTGGASTCDALLRGLPVISRYGKRHGTRFSYSLLANVGLDDLAAANDEEYVEKAVALANNKERIKAIHENLPRIMMKSPIMDVKGYVRQIETVYEQVWQKWMIRAKG